MSTEQRILEWQHVPGTAPLTGYVIWLDGVEIARTATADKSVTVEVPDVGGCYQVSAYGINPDGGGEIHGVKSLPACVSQKPSDIKVTLTFSQ